VSNPLSTLGVLVHSSVAIGDDSLSWFLVACLYSISLGNNSFMDFLIKITAVLNFISSEAFLPF